MLKNEELLRFFKTAYCFTDSQRNTAYENWISENVKDKIVIDLGAGSGILCYLAVKYGAKKVYALERRGRLIHRMKEILGDTVEYIHADLLETELPECDIYLHEWLTSEFWNEKRFLRNFYEEGDKELEVGHILDLVEYAKKNNFIDKLYEVGVEVCQTGANLRVRRINSSSINCTNVLTEPFPGFPTDLQAQMMALLSVADGVSSIEEKIFENRFMHVPELIRMGANIEIKGRKATISGVDKQKIGQFASVVRSKRPPEPFKGKGIRYSDEYVVRKEGKKK